MKISIAAVTFAIAASFASAGEENNSPTPQPSGERDGKSGKSGAGEGSGSGKSGKSGGGTKSGKSGCTDCSADTLTRANTVTSLTYDTYGDNGVLNYQSLVDFCCDEEGRTNYLQAIEFTSGCLAYTNCLVGEVFDKVSDPSSNETVTEGGFLTASVNTLCLAEQFGFKLPFGGGESCATPEELCQQSVSENSCNPSSAPSSQPSSEPSSEPSCLECE